MMPCFTLSFPADSALQASLTAMLFTW